MLKFGLILITFIFFKITTGLAEDVVRKIQIGNIPNSLSFDKTILTARRGEKIQLTFKNNDPTDGSGMSHNWILIKPGTIKKVSEMAEAAGPNHGYVPADENVIAHTNLIVPGQSQILNFTVPKAAGKYPFICGFPGHSALMRGLLIVK